MTGFTSNRFFSTLPLISGLLFFMASIYSQAELMPDLYDVDIIVADQSEGVRQEALQTALLTVLIRISGQENLTTQNTHIQKSLKNSERYLQQFSYSSTIQVLDADPLSTELLSTELLNTSLLDTESAESNGGINSPAEENEAATKTIIHLNARFNKNAVTALLREAGLPVWSNNRPSILVWALVDTPEGRSFLQQYTVASLGKSADAVLDTTPLGSKILYEEMQRRGLPLHNPRYDTQDRMKVNSTVLWQENAERIIQASERYATDAILFGRVAKTNSTRSKQWLGNWHFVFQGNTYPINANADSLQSFVAKGVDGASNILVKRYAINPQHGEGETLLEVSGVRSFAHYTQVLHHLQALEPVNHVMIESVNDDTVRYSLKTEGGTTLLQELIDLGGLLTLKIDNRTDSNEQDIATLNTKKEMVESESTKALYSEALDTGLFDEEGLDPDAFDQELFNKEPFNKEPRPLQYMLSL